MQRAEPPAASVPAPKPPPKPPTPPPPPAAAGDFPDAQQNVYAAETHADPAAKPAAEETDFKSICWEGQLTEGKGSGLCEFVVELQLRKTVEQGISFQARQVDAAKAEIRICLLGERPPLTDGPDDNMRIENWSRPYECGAEEGIPVFDGEYVKGDVEVLNAFEVTARSRDMNVPLEAGKHYCLVQGNPESAATAGQRISLEMKCPRDIGTVRTLQVTQEMHNSVALSNFWGFLHTTATGFTASSMRVDGKDVPVPGDSERL